MCSREATRMPHTLPRTTPYKSASRSSTRCRGFRTPLSTESSPSVVAVNRRRVNCTISGLHLLGRNERLAPRLKRAVWMGQSARSLDHLIGAAEQHRRHFEAERVRGPEIDAQLEF